MQNHTYRGIRIVDPGPQLAGSFRVDATVNVLVDDQPLPMSRLAKHIGPNGYEWGDCSAGPVALAHSIIAFEVDEPTADLVYQHFAADVVAGFPRGTGGVEWTLSSDQIRDWLRTHTLLIDDERQTRATLK